MVGDNESVAVTLLPSTTVREYMDGRKEVAIQIELSVKSLKQSISYNNSLKISNHLVGAADLTSKNNTYIYEDCRVTNTPHIVVVDERGYVVYVTSLEINIIVN